MSYNLSATTTRILPVNEDKGLRDDPATYLPSPPQPNRFPIATASGRDTSLEAKIKEAERELEQEMNRYNVLSQPVSRRKRSVTHASDTLTKFMEEKKRNDEFLNFERSATVPGILNLQPTHTSSSSSSSTTVSPMDIPLSTSPLPPKRARSSSHPTFLTNLETLETLPLLSGKNVLKYLDKRYESGIKFDKQFDKVFAKQREMEREARRSRGVSGLARTPSAPTEGESLMDEDEDEDERQELLWKAPAFMPGGGLSL